MYTAFLLQASSPLGSSIFMMVAMLAVFWFMIARPQMKRQRAQKSFSEELKRGDQIVTSSGILGRVTDIDEQIVTLEIGSKTQIRVTRNAISKELTEAIYPSATATK